MKTILSKCSVAKRYIIVIMIFMGYANITILNTNISMAVVDMTTVKNVSTSWNSFEMRAEYNWTSQQKGLILSSYSYGRLFSPVGGLLATKLGGSTICSIGNLVMAVVTFLSPLILSVDFTLFFIVYLIFGAFQALLICGAAELIVHWAPPEERFRFVSFGEIGFFFGSIASFILSGLLLEKCNWRTLFYCSGVGSFVWFWIWLIIVKNDPEQDKYMTESERKYLKEKINCNYSEEKMAYPWKKIATFVPLWIDCLAMFSIVCGFIFTSVFLPQYIKDTTSTDIADIGFISTIPQICSVISLPICGCFADYIRSLDKLSITNTHRLFAGVSLFSATIFFAVMAAWPYFIVNIAAISLFQFFSTLLLADVTVLFLDISPKYTALLVSIVNMFAITAGFIVPSVVESIVTSHSLYQWNICFMIYSSMYFCAALIYLRFISVKLPDWAKTESMTEKGHEMNSKVTT